MKTPHKHRDLIIAWAFGAEIQVQTACGWEDVVVTNPSWNDDMEYRIKPEPKPDVFLHCHMDQRGFDSLTERFVDGDNLKLTFSGETGKLKSAEVIS